MNEPANITNKYAGLLIAFGLFGFIARYVTEGDFQVTALIPAAIGGILLIIKKAMNEATKMLIAGMIVALIMGILSAQRLFIDGMPKVFERSSLLYILISISSFYAFVLYLKVLIQKKKEKAQNQGS